MKLTNRPFDISGMIASLFNQEYSENELHIMRFDRGHKQTLGHFYVINKKEGVILQGYTLELPWLNNAKNISCIPEGDYDLNKRWSNKFKRFLYEVESVPNRSNILIHSGNYYTDILGCVLVGNEMTDINNDKYSDVINSVKTLKKIHKLLKPQARLKIGWEGK